MGIAILTALLVGGATGLGALLGIGCKIISYRFHDIVMAFAAGVMLSASILSLILPAVERGGMIITIVGIFIGAAGLTALDQMSPRIFRLLGKGCHSTNPKYHAALFVTAIAIHNFPEGLAAGVSLGTGDIPQALLIAGGIAIQNIPEGIVTVTPLLAAGVGPEKALAIGALTGVIEILGTMFGYYAVTITQSVLPFFLSFAGGTMLYVICDEMVPETHQHGNGIAATYSLLLGFCVMMAADLLF